MAEPLKQQVGTPVVAKEGFAVKEKAQANYMIDSWEIDIQIPILTDIEIRLPLTTKGSGRQKERGQVNPASIFHFSFHLSIFLSFIFPSLVVSFNKPPENSAKEKSHLWLISWSFKKPFPVSLYCVLRSRVICILKLETETLSCHSLLFCSSFFLHWEETMYNLDRWRTQKWGIETLGFSSGQQVWKHWKGWCLIALNQNRTIQFNQKPQAPRKLLQENHSKKVKVLTEPKFRKKGNARTSTYLKFAGEKTQKTIINWWVLQNQIPTSPILQWKKPSVSPIRYAFTHSWTIRGNQNQTSLSIRSAKYWQRDGTKSSRWLTLNPTTVGEAWI